VTPEQAGQLLSNYEAGVQTYVEGLDDNALLEGIDAARADLVKADPSAAEEYGLNKAEVANNAKPVEQPVEQQRPDTAVRADGLDPEVAKALDHPQVRAAIEGELSKASEAERAATADRQQAYSTVLSAMVSVVPELAQIPTERWGEAVKILEQSDPAKARAIYGLVERGAQIERAMFGDAQQRQEASQRQFEAYRAEQNALFDKQVGKVSQEDIRAVNTYVSDVLKLSPAEAGQLRNSPTAVDARFQRALLDASRYHAAKASAPRATSPKTPTQRPSAGERAPAKSRLESKASLTEAEGWELLQQRMRG
jgi:hypothetical protein